MIKEVIKIKSGTQKILKVNFVLLYSGLLLFFMSLMPLVIAHSEIESKNLFDNKYFLLFLPLVAILLGVLITNHFEKTMKKIEVEKLKKIVFVAIVIVTSIVSLYILFSTIYINLASWSKGPVHWHADLEIEICGEKFYLPESKGLSNKVGTNLLHTHNDMRIHVEGPIMEKLDATLGEFFDSVGIEFNDDQIANMKNRDICKDGSVGKVRMFVNGEENFEFRDYFIKPYADVPPGDRIKITFGE